MNRTAATALISLLSVVATYVVALGAGDVPPDWVIGKRLTPVGIAQDSVGRIYVTNQWPESVSVFGPDAKGPASPIAIISGSNSGLANPIGIALDPAGKIYVLNDGADYDKGPNRINVYAAGSNGNVAPIAVLAGHRTRLEYPGAVAVDLSGKIYAVDGGGNADIESPPRVMVYAAGSKGDVAPIAIISGNRTGLNMPDGIAVYANGRIYVTNDPSPNAPGAPEGYIPGATYDDTVTVYAPGAKGNVAPIATIIGIDTGIGEPQSIALDSGGRIYVANASGYDGKTLDPHGAYLHWKSITAYPADANADIAPIATIKGAQTGLTDPKGVTVSPNGKIYVTSCPPSEPGVATVYPADSNGNVKPIATITDGADTKLDSPTARESRVRGVM
jgi:hypothetical protein